MAVQRRSNLNLLLDLALVEDDSSDDDSQDSEDDLDMLFLATFMETKVLGPRINIEDLNEAECESLFRFQKDDIKRLHAALQIPERYTGYQRTSATGMEALLILLKRLTYPNRWSELTTLFGRSEPELSIIFNMIVDDVYERYQHLLSSLDLVWLDPCMFSAAIYAKGAPLETCWGFIDATARAICRPIRNQNIMYSGHRKIHCLKFQSVLSPNGLITNMFGPVEGRRHDAFVLGASGILTQLAERMSAPDGTPYCVYGDQAYPLNAHILSPYRGAQLTAEQNRFNKDMSSVRISVEWAFGKIAKLFAFLDYAKNLKVLLQPVGKLYLVGTLLINCHTCLYGSQTSSFFEIDPPQLEVYLANA